MSYIKNGDCLDLMKDIKSKSIDMILCDLPYGTTRNKWDIQIDLKLLWEEYERIIKDYGAIVLFSQAPFDKKLAMSNIDLFHHEWIWEKHQGSNFLTSKKMPMKVHENILVFYKNLPTYNPQKTKSIRKVSTKASKEKSIHRMSAEASKEKNITFGNYGKHENVKTYDSCTRFPRSVIKFKSDKQLEHYHRTQKPLKLIEYLIKTYTKKHNIVLDNCMGSGTTIVGCLRTQRRYIGFEKDLDYFNIAQKRIDKVKDTHKLKLFN